MELQVDRWTDCRDNTRWVIWGPSSVSTVIATLNFRCNTQATYYLILFIIITLVETPLSVNRPPWGRFTHTQIIYISI